MLLHEQRRLASRVRQPAQRRLGVLRVAQVQEQREVAREVAAVKVPADQVVVATRLFEKLGLQYSQARVGLARAFSVSSRDC